MSERIKDNLPTPEAVRAKLRGVMKSDLPDFLSTTQSRRDELISNQKYIVMAFALMVSIVFFLYMVQVQFGTMAAYFAVGSMLLWSVVMLLSGRQFYTNSDLMVREVNMALVPIIMNVLNRTLLYTHSDGSKEQARQALEDSLLLTSKNLTVEYDDSYQLFGGLETTIHELIVKYERPQASGQSSKWEVFRGILVNAELERDTGAETYISTDGERSGFANQSFWNELFGRGEKAESVVEWDDFERHLAVFTTDPAASREILYPEFMEDLYDWWLEHRLNIRVAIKGKRMYLLLPDPNLRIESTTFSTKPEAIERYAWSILRPLWRSLQLVEDVQR